MNILVGHLDGSMTLRQLAILASVWEADLADDSFNIPDIADLCNLPRSTASSVVARLRDSTANGMGCITLEMDSRDRRRNFVRPSRHLKKTG
jgi:DNA-binding MarR family transcriptional regulator